MQLSFPKNLTALLILSATFVLIPFLPYTVTTWADNMIVRLILLVGFAAAVYVNPLIGLLVLMNIGILFIARNKAKIDILRAETSIADSNSEAIQSIQTPPTAPPMPEYDEAGAQTYDYAPQEDSGDNSFEPVAESINMKVAPEPAISNSSYKAMHQLFGDVKPLEEDQATT